MRKLIKEVSSIQTGYFGKPSGKGSVVYLQAKHFNEYGQLQDILYPDLEAENISERHFLEEGNVLFAAKGTKNFAAVFENHNEPAVASTSFFVIKLTDVRILPQYLTWFLNNYETQAILKGQAIGTSMPSISKQVLENLEIFIPNIETQKVILRITNLRNREKELKQQIERLREKQIQQQIINAIK